MTTKEFNDWCNIFPLLKIFSNNGYRPDDFPPLSKGVTKEEREKLELDARWEKLHQESEE